MASVASRPALEEMLRVRQRKGKLYRSEIQICIKKKRALDNVVLVTKLHLFVTLWTVAHQAPLAMAFPRQEYWSVLPFPYPRDIPNPEIEPMSPALAG